MTTHPPIGEKAAQAEPVRPEPVPAPKEVWTQVPGKPLDTNQRGQLRTRDHVPGKPGTAP